MPARLAVWILLAAPCWCQMPKSVAGLYRSGNNSIRITAKPEGKADVNVKLYYANGHTCALHKDAQWTGHHLLVVAEGLVENEPCRLEASFAHGRILLKDEGQRCAQTYCGTRGKLDAVSLPKSRAVHH